MEGRASELSDPAVVVRAAGVDEADGLVHRLRQIEVEAGVAFRAIGMDDVADDEPAPVAAYLAAVADGRIWVAELDGAVVGYAWAVDLDGQPHLEQISVVPAVQGRGVGAALIGAVAAWARRRGPSLTLSTFRDVAWNAPYYERRGFVVLPEADLPDRFRPLRMHEAELGLDLSARVIMVLEFEGRAGPDGGKA